MDSESKFALIFFAILAFLALDSCSFGQERYIDSTHTVEFKQVDWDDDGKEYELFLKGYGEADVSSSFYNKVEVGDTIAILCAEGTFTPFEYEKSYKLLAKSP